MSHIGKLTRGLQYWNKRNQDMQLPEGITLDPNKMKDVNYYKEFIKGKKVLDVDRALMRLRALSKIANGRNTLIYKELKDKLSNWPEEETKSKVKK